MSPSEKKLLSLFAVAGFVIINLVGFKFYSSKKTEVQAKRVDAEQKLAMAETFRSSREQVLDQMDWLAENEPEPAAYQDVQSSLQQLIEREAQTNALTIRPNSQKLLPTDQDPNKHYHRAKVQITVTGMERQLYAWFDRLTDPKQFRAVTNIQLSPDREDDTKITCTAIIEQWFVPTPAL